MNPATVLIKSHWRDYGNRERQLWLRLPFSLDLASVQGRALELLGIVQAVSDAVLVRYSLIWEFIPDVIGEPALTSDVRAFVGIFYRSSDETQTECIWIPSPRADLFEGAGIYAGIRANAAAAGLAPFIDPALAGSLCTVEGAVHPSAFTVAGLRL